jgi:hypothetical protein
MVVRQASGGAPGQGLDDLLLVLEVVIDVGLGDAEFGAEHVHGGADQAVAVEQVLGRAQDALALVDAVGDRQPRRCGGIWRRRRRRASVGGEGAGAG